MDSSPALYLVFLVCGVGQIFAFSAPMVVAAVIPFAAVVALFAGWLPVLAAALALYRSRVAAWIAIAGAGPALLMAIRAGIVGELVYAAFFGVPPAITVVFAVRRIRSGASISRRPFQSDMSSVTRVILAAVPLGLFVLSMSRLAVR
jgi:hypothetical protein